MPFGESSEGKKQDFHVVTRAYARGKTKGNREIYLRDKYNSLRDRKNYL